MLSEKSQGKSGSFFFFSQDGNFLIKTIYKRELEVLLGMLPNYFKYLQDNRTTRLCRYLGLHQMKCYKKGQKTIQVYILIMNNMALSPNEDNVIGVYDLKGSTFQRLTPPEKVLKGATRKDENFILEKQ